MTRTCALGVLALAAAISVPAQAQAQTTREPSAQTAQRPRITIYPRGLPPSAKRHCRSWLAQEYRVSGPVIVPRMQCWWQ